MPWGGTQCLGGPRGERGGGAGGREVGKSLACGSCGKEQLRQGGQPWDGLVEITSGDSQAS